MLEDFIAASSRAIGHISRAAGPTLDEFRNSSQTPSLRSGSQLAILQGGARLSPRLGTNPLLRFLRSLRLGSKSNRLRNSRRTLA
jgi:hypothetical protein